MSATLGTILTAAVTPMHPDGSIDEAGFTTLVRYLADNGSDGIVVAGTTGESPTLSSEEKLTLVRLAAAEVGDRCSIIAGTGSYDTAATISLTVAAADAGADAVLVVTPYYNKPPRAGLVAHFTAVADASPVPVTVYNIPARVVLDLPPDLLAELAQHERITAVKQANTDDLADTRRLRELAPDLDIYAGNDDALLDIMELGGVGGICVASHLAGGRMAEMCELVRAGDVEAARAINTELEPLFAALAVTTNPIPVKAALDQLGLPAGTLRLPLVPATTAEREHIGAALEDLGMTAAPVA